MSVKEKEGWSMFGWGKIKGNSMSVKVEADFSLTFPMLVLGGFKD
ncbi:MAG: hypothetical protein ACMXYB_01705 [Candidatus Woesearchaeota archaeon]